MTLTDAARLTTLGRRTARGLLLTLTELNYVDTDGKVLWLTPKLTNLSRGLLMHLGVGTSSAANWKTLTDRLEESSSVGILEANKIIHIERVEVRRILDSRIVNGTRLPASCSSIGRVLLAALSDQDLHKWLQSYELKKMTEHTITDRQEFWDKIMRIR